MSLLTRVLAAIACASPLAFPPGQAAAQDEPPPVTRLVLHPAVEPAPALKYRLLPGRDELVPGNAALFYYRAIQMMLETNASRAASPDPAKRKPSAEDTSYEWSTMALRDLPLDEVREYLNRYRNALAEIEMGALRADCDWEFDNRPEAFEMLIPEIQQARSLARLVALRARVALRDGRHDEALHWLQVGMALSRHVARGPFMVQGLVAVASTMNFAVPLEDLIQAPGMPSLYWALAELPHPWIEPTAFDGERLLLERWLPQLSRLDGLPWSVEEGRSFAEAVHDKMFRLADWTSPAGRGKDAHSWYAKATVAALVAQAYPTARRALIARGRSKDLVEAMPAVQVVFLDAYLDYQVYRDNIFKWAGLPFPQAYPGMGRAQDVRAEIRSRPILMLFCSVVAAIPSYLTATHRVERRLDALRCVEAIGLYAAGHHNLPDRLEDIKNIDVPADPMTGKPFLYRLENGRAFLSAPAAPAGFTHPSFSIHYSIELAP